MGERAAPAGHVGSQATEMEMGGWSGNWVGVTERRRMACRPQLRRGHPALLIQRCRQRGGRAQRGREQFGGACGANLRGEAAVQDERLSPKRAGAVSHVAATTEELAEGGWVVRRASCSGAARRLAGEGACASAPGWGRLPSTWSVELERRGREG